MPDTNNNTVNPKVFVQDSTPTNPFGVGYFQQAVATSQRLVAEREATEKQLLAELNDGPNSFANLRDSKAALKALKADPNADPAAIAAAETKINDISASREELRKQADQNAALLEQTQRGLINNEASLSQAQAKAASIPPGAAIVNAGADTAAQSTYQVPPNEQTPAVNDTPPAATTYYENDGTATTDAIPKEQAPATTYYENDGTATTDAIPKEQAPATTYYENDGTASSTNTVPQADGVDLAAERNDAAAVDAANAQPGFGFNPDSEEQAQAAAKSATLAKAQLQNTIASQRRNPNNGDWRVKLQLAPGAEYLYNDPQGAGILAPLRGTGIIFPYTPTISTAYKATYSSYDLTHSNYKGYYYQGSQVEPVSLSCPFTAQSTKEAEYLLAVIHFFKSVTKMFYGQDPQRGTPPPLVYLTGLGEFQFNEHPCVVQSFTYELPTDVDYIRARSQNVNNSNMLYKRQSTNPSGPGTTWGNGILGNFLGGAINRLANAGLPKGGMNIPPSPPSFGLNSPTYVPTKMTISISLLPVQSRKQQSQQFSLRQYANGDLLKGGFW